MIPVLPSQNLSHLARVIPGFSGCTAIGEIYDECNKPRTVYLKAFPGRSRGLANELAYWMISRGLFLTTASAAWVVLVDTHFLRALWPHITWPDGNIPCWATQEIDNASPEVMSVTDSPIVTAELKQWAEVWDVIALHEWVANADGNAGNYVRLGPCRYAAIDGADIFGGQDWTPGTLGKLGYTHNKLAHLVNAIVDHHVTPAAANHVKTAAARHGTVLFILEQELIRWLSMLLGATDAYAAVEFLKVRIGLENTRWHLTSELSTT